MNKDRWNYTLFASLQFPDTPNTRDRECVYAVAFNVLDPKYFLYFAAVVNNRVSISYYPG
jgi:threonine/homoserine/homoserine lactone efflux protein